VKAGVFYFDIIMEAKCFHCEKVNDLDEYDSDTGYMFSKFLGDICHAKKGLRDRVFKWHCVHCDNEFEIKDIER